MKLFYVQIPQDIYNSLSRIELKTLQSDLGKLIVKYVATNVYNIEDYSVTREKNKPQFIYSDLEFNISHSKNTIVAAFDKYPLGIDIEYMQDRNFKKFIGHYNINTTEKIEFYRQWTKLEANIKIQAEIRQSYTFELLDNYMLTIVSSNPEKQIMSSTRIPYPKLFLS